MLTRICKSLLIAALVLSLSSQWMVVQSIAWASMLVSYSQTNTLSQALAMTFDGQHPCHLCKVASETKHSEQQRQGVQPDLKVEASIARSDVLVFPPASPVCTPLGSELAPAEPETPPVPPPRSSSLG